jgi:hypothetical protein
VASRTAVIHQPNYLPGLTYFDKIAAADVFVLLDNVQYIKRNWINRNRIKTADGPQWLTVPVVTKGRYTQTITETPVDNSRSWQREHTMALRLNYARAPHFDDLAPSILDALQGTWDHLAEMNEELLCLLCRVLGISTPFMRASELGVDGSSSALLAGICTAVGADRYLSGPGGRKYMDVDVFAAAGIDLVFHDYQHPTYRQLHGTFEPDLSVCDLLFNEGPDSLAILRSGTQVLHA